MLTQMQPGTGSPLISVITRTLGQASFLARCRGALHAAVSGLDCAVDWIIVDDGAPDSEALRAFARGSGLANRLIPLVVESNAHHRAKAANAGLGAASTPFVHFLDDDDVVKPDFYVETLSLLRGDPRLGGAAVGVEGVEETEGLVEIRRWAHYPEIQAISLASLSVTQHLALGSILFRREALERTGGFDSAFAVCEDYELLLRFLLHCDIGRVSHPLMSFHQRPSAAGAAGNSAVTRNFAAEDAYFRNAMLRRDIASGRAGLGWLLAVGELSRGSVKSEKLLDRLYRNLVVKRVFGLMRGR